MESLTHNRISPEQHRMYGRITIYLWLGLFFVLVILSLWVLVYSPWIRFNHIDVPGADRAATAEVLVAFRRAALQRPLWRYFGATNMVLWFLEPLDFRFVLPTVDVRVEPHWFSQLLTFTVVPHERFMIWCADLNCVWVDNRGMVLEPAPQGDGQLLPTLHDDAHPRFVPGVFFLSDVQFKNLKIILNMLSESGVPYEQLSLERASLDLTITLASGTVYLFNLSNDLSATPSLLSDIQSKIDTAHAQYVDFRILGKIYYKKI